MKEFMNTKILTMLVVIFFCLVSNIFAGPKIKQQELQVRSIKPPLWGITREANYQGYQNRVVKKLRIIIETQLREAEVQFAPQNPENRTLSDAEGNPLLYPYNAIHDDPIVIARAEEILSDITNFPMNEIDDIELKSLDELLYYIERGKISGLISRSPIEAYIQRYNMKQLHNNLVKPFRAIVEAELRAEGIEFTAQNLESSSDMSMMEQYKGYPDNAPADDPLVVERGRRIMRNVTGIFAGKHMNSLDHILYLFYKFEPAAIIAYVRNKGHIDLFDCESDLNIASRLFGE